MMTIRYYLFAIHPIVYTILLLPAVIVSSISTGGLWRWVRGGEYMTREGLAVYEFGGRDVIHFLNTRSEDAILLESDGHFALIDAAEHSRPGADGQPAGGHERYIIDYIQRVAGGNLDFVLATHPHIDHMGGFRTILRADGITVGRAYARPGESRYHAELAEACAEKGIELIQEGLDGLQFTLGNMRLTILNGGPDDPRAGVNGNSMCLLVECNGSNALLAADTNYASDTEMRLADAVGGRLDLLKVGHHGYDGSNGPVYLARLRPATAVYTNIYDWININVKRRFALVSNTTQLCTGDFGGIAAVFGAGGVGYYAIGEYPSGIGGME